MDAIRSLKPAPGVYSVIEDGRAVLLDSRRGEYFGLNAVGTRVWAAIEGAESADPDPAELLDSLVAEYRLGRAELEEDIGKFLKHLRDHKLVLARE